VDARSGLRETVDTVYRPNVVTGFVPDDGYDLVVDAVRDRQGATAHAEIVPNLGRATLLLFHNNRQTLGAVDARLSKDRYVLGLPQAGGALAGEALHGTLGGGVTLGASTSGGAAPEDVEAAAREHLETVEELFRGVGFQPDLVEDMEHWYWGHFASTAVWSAAVAKAGGFDRFVKDARAIHQALLAGREAMDVCRARGVDLRLRADASPFLTDPAVSVAAAQLLLGGPVAQRRALAQSAYSGEFRRYYDEVVEAARRLDLRTPHLDSFGTAVDR
jgi:2-dehydropantoate 2-reductase